MSGETGANWETEWIKFGKMMANHAIIVDHQSHLKLPSYLFNFPMS